MILEQRFNKNDYDVINFIREQRHDFMNYLQVILGYLQLNKPDCAVQYIKQVTREIQELSSVTKIENPYLVTALLLVFQKGKSLGVRLSLKVEQGSSLMPDLCGTLITDQIIGIIELIFQNLSLQGAENRQLEIGLKEFDDHIMIIISGATSLAAKDLLTKIESLLKQNPLVRGSLEREKSLDEIRILFQVTKNK